MKKRKKIYISAFCLLFAAMGVIAAFADGYDTPTIPIHTKHIYDVVSETEATCTQGGEVKYKCRYCTKSYTDVIEPLGHRANNIAGVNGVEVELECEFCDESFYATIGELESYWDIQYVNKAPNRTGEDESGYLDLDGNGIINAKDYGILTNLHYV